MLCLFWRSASATGCFSRYWRHGTAFGGFSMFRKSSYFYIFICPSNKAIFLQEDILKLLLEPTRLSVVVNHWLFLTISLPLLGLEFLSELFAVKLAIPPKDFMEHSINSEYITQNMRTYSPKITINKMKVMFIFYCGSH